MTDQEKQRERILDKAQKLRAHAESAGQLGNEAEAHAFAAACQRLMDEHDIGLTEVEFARLDVTDPIDLGWVDHQAWGLPLKRARVEWQERLAQVVAWAHHCKIVVQAGSNEFALVGRKSHREQAEYLFVTLYRLAERMVERAYATRWRECERAGDVTACRGFKHAWLTGFISELSRRFVEERQQVRAEHAESQAIVRLGDQLAKVDAWMKDTGRFKARASSLVRSVYNREGLDRGRAAAREVGLKAHAIRQGATPGQRRLA